MADFYRISGCDQSSQAMFSFATVTIGISSSLQESRLPVPWCCAQTDCCHSSCGYPIWNQHHCFKWLKKGYWLHAYHKKASPICWREKRWQCECVCLNQSRQSTPKKRWSSVVCCDEDEETGRRHGSPLHDEHTISRLWGRCESACELLFCRLIIMRSL